MKTTLAILIAALLSVSPGCSAKVESGPDSVKVEAELPKVEVNKLPDLNPKTDDDVDIKTPDSDGK